MRILITGAAGFLGSHISKKFLEENHEVIGVDNFFRGVKENLPNHVNFTFFKHDLINKEETIKLFNEVRPDYVINYAAINGTRYFYDIPFKVCDDNIRITQNVLSASRIESVTKIVFASSSEVYGPEPAIPTKETHDIVLKTGSNRDSYASSKAIGEFLTFLWAKENAKNYLIIRPFNTYGKNMINTKYGQVIPEFIKRAKDDETFTIAGDGRQTRSFCHVTDHANILYKLTLEQNNEIFNIGFDEEICILDLAKTIHEKLNKVFNPVHLPSWENDTKWRVPSLEKLKGVIGEYKFINLEDGLNTLIL
jgi:nucleoside-diphosphate-sugar epimerase